MQGYKIEKSPSMIFHIWLSCLLSNIKMHWWKLHDTIVIGNSHNGAPKKEKKKKKKIYFFSGTKKCPNFALLKKLSEYDKGWNLSFYHIYGFGVGVMV